MVKMARSNVEIESIISELKTNRNARDKQIIDKAAILDGVDDKNAFRLRSLIHVKEIAQDEYVCSSCNVIRNNEGDVVGMSHEEHDLYDITEPSVDGEPVTRKGLYTLLVDESFEVIGSLNVNNL